MKFSVASTLLLADALVSAQSTSTTVYGPVGTSLPDLVSGVNSCLLGCLSQTAEALKCSPTDLDCLCGKPTRLSIAMAGCANTSECQGIDDAASRLVDICKIMEDEPSQDAIASASNVLESALASITTQAASATKTGDSDSAAAGSLFGLTSYDLISLSAAAAAAAALVAAA